MKTLQYPVESDFEIKKSRFIGRVETIHSHAEGLARIAALWQQHPEARHVCYVMLVRGQVRQSDDGEPSGTAARPMLNVLQHKGLDNVLASVVRYFGGIKLGAGGLVRAYSQAISDPLNTAELIEVRPQSTVVIHFQYEHESLVRHLADQYGLNLDVQYAERVTAQVSGEIQALEPFLEMANSQLRGELIHDGACLNAP
ncbi:putative transport system protein [Nitrincola lacisaponensis]|uniref:Putative transport system protein n=1 Tax=Nitrincola lacisaponensis TaxID=267850 RepID=A0A063Y5Y0_9GAMM|nr:YigZ family protein [Nitrincola lacisaponensis]KDE40176.1 putative transport system protein [Nitrincola lacisaponensis]